MGLDMYLNGKKFMFDRDENLKEDGYPLKEKILALGYWRKHPNLHGFIVQNFAEGVDRCQEIELYEECIDKILDAIGKDELPHTEGFFFGRSYGDQDGDLYLKEKNHALQTFTNAKEWLKNKEDGVWKSVVYQASW